MKITLTTIVFNQAKMRRPKSRIPISFVVKMHSEYSKFFEELGMDSVFKLHKDLCRNKTQISPFVFKDLIDAHSETWINN